MVFRYRPIRFWMHTAHSTCPTGAVFPAPAAPFRFMQRDKVTRVKRSPTVSTVHWAGAIDPSQNLYISNVYVYGSSYYHGTITVYPQGKTKPSETIQGPLKAPHGLALDSHQNLFVADPYAGASVGQVFEVAKGTTTPVPLYLNGLTEPIEVATDGSDNLYVSDNVENVVQIMHQARRRRKSPKAIPTVASCRMESALINRDTFS